MEKEALKCQKEWSSSARKPDLIMCLVLWLECAFKLAVNQSNDAVKTMGCWTAPVSLRAYTCVFTCVYMYCTHRFLYVNVCTCYTHAHIHVYTHVNVCTSIGTWIRIRIVTWIRICIIYIYMYSQRSVHT